MRGLTFALKQLLRASTILAALSVSACMQTASDVTNKDHPNASDAVHSIDLQPRYPRAAGNANTGGAPPVSASYFGNPVEAPVVEAPTADATGGFALNFENTPVATVAKVVLGDILNVGYVIDPRVQGSISLSSGRPIAKKDMLFVLENALRANNLVLLRDTVGYRIVPATDGSIGAVDHVDAKGEVEAGYGLTVIPVQYVSGATLVKLMEGFASKPGTVRTDPTGKLLLVIGSGSERQAAVDTVRNFDVDWLRGQSVGIYPVHNSAPDPMVAELEKIMDSGDSGLSHNLVKFQTIERQNSILVVASNAELLRAAATWIARLDRSSVASTGVKVYRVKYGDAKQISESAGNKIFGGGLLVGFTDSATSQSGAGLRHRRLYRRSIVSPAGRSPTRSGARAPRAGGESGPVGGCGRVGNAMPGALTGKGRAVSSPGALPGVRITAGRREQFACSSTPAKKTSSIYRSRPESARPA